MNCLLARAALADEFDVVSVNDGNAALAILEHSVFDLVLMDLNMPNLSGYEVATLYRKSNALSQSIVVAYSASRDPSSVARARASGMDGHISRPIAPPELRLEVERYLSDLTIEPGRLTVWRRSAFDELVLRIGSTRLISFLICLHEKFSDVHSMLVEDAPSPEEIGRQTHDLASVAGMFGFEEVFLLCRLVQSYAEGQLDRERLCEAIKRADTALISELSQLP